MTWLPSSIISVALLLASAGCAKESGKVAPSAFAFSEGSACDSSEYDPYSPDRIQLAQAPSLTVDVAASLNCIAKVGDPSLQEVSGKIIVGVRETYPSSSGADVAAACNCSKELRFKLQRAVPSGTIVEFQVDGRTTATASAP